MVLQAIRRLLPIIQQPADRADLSDIDDRVLREAMALIDDSLKTWVLTE